MNKTIIKERPIDTIFNWRKDNYQIVKDNVIRRSCDICAFKNKCYNLFLKNCRKTNRLTNPLQRMHCSSKTRNDNVSIHYINLNKKL